MKLCLFTVSFAGLWGQHRLTLEQSIDKAAQLGFDGLEIMGKRPHLSPLDYSIDACKRLRESITAKKLQVAAVAAYTNFNAGGDSPGMPFGEMQIAYVEALAERAAALGCDLVRIFASYERADQSFDIQWQNTVRGIRECCDRAGKFGVKIGLQNHHDIACASKTLRELMLQVDHPNLFSNFDCWSVHLRGEDVAAEAKALAGKTLMTTVADYVVLPRSKYRVEFNNYAEQQPPYAIAVPMGTGDLNYQDFFAGLLAGGFDGWVSYEMCSLLRDGGELATLESYARAFLKYMAEIKAGDHVVGCTGKFE